MKKKLCAYLALNMGTSIVAGLTVVAAVALGSHTASAETAPAAESTPAGVNITPEGDFEKNEASGLPAGWKASIAENVESVREYENSFVRVKSTTTESRFFVGRIVKLDPAWKRLQITCKLRSNVEAVGDQSWNGARFTWQFEDATNTVVKPYPKQPTLRTSKEWTVFDVSAEVPQGATQIRLMPGMWGAKGTVDIDEVRVLALTQ